MIGAAIAIGSLGMSAYGKYKSGEANRKAQDYLKNQQRELTDYLYGELGKNYLETNEGKSVLKDLRERIAKSNARSEAQTAMNGGSHESAIAAKEAAAKGYTDTLGRLATIAEQRKAALRGQLMGAKGQYSQAIYGGIKERAGQWDNLSANAFQLGSSSLMSMGGKSTTDGAGGGSQVPYDYTKTGSGTVGGYNPNQDRNLA